MHSIISLFTGAGGLDLGMEAAGFSTRVCLELDPAPCLTLQANRDWAVIQKNIQEISARKIMGMAGLRKGQASLLIGGPPCQPFSKSGYWKNGSTLRMKDPRATTLKEYLRVLVETQPEVFLLENVPGFAFTGKSEGLDYFLREIKRINREFRTNYSLTWKVLNAADYGVPQRRERLFVIGCKSGRQFIFPQATHSSNNPDLRHHLTAWDAIGDLAESADREEYKIGGRWASIIPSIPEGRNYLWHTERGGGKPIFKWRSRFWNFLLKLSRNEPSWTIQASPGPSTGPFHWTNRRLTEHEMCRLQTFPNAYRIVGSPRSAQRQIGNAVPSALAELLGIEIRKQLFGETVRRQLTLIPRVRSIQHSTAERSCRARP